MEHDSADEAAIVHWRGKYKSCHQKKVHLKEEYAELKSQYEALVHQHNEFERVTFKAIKDELTNMREQADTWKEKWTEEHKEHENVTAELVEARAQLNEAH